MLQAPLMLRGPRAAHAGASCMARDAMPAQPGWAGAPPLPGQGLLEGSTPSIACASTGRAESCITKLYYPELRAASQHSTENGVSSIGDGGVKPVTPSLCHNPASATVEKPRKAHAAESGKPMPRKAHAAESRTRCGKPAALPPNMRRHPAQGLVSLRSRQQRAATACRHPFGNLPKFPRRFVPCCFMSHGCSMFLASSPRNHGARSLNPRASLSHYQQ